MADIEKTRRDQIKRLNKAYDNLINELAKIYQNARIDEDKLFLLDNQPKNQKRLATKAFRAYRKAVMQEVETAQEIGWDKGSEDFLDLMIERVDDLKDELTKEQYENKINAIKKQKVKKAELNKLKNRKIGVTKISDRVWDIQNLAKENIEIALTDALGKGKSAQELARSIKHNLNRPNDLFRRVRDSRGKLVPSKKMRAYKTGAGVYKSAHKNAIRLARNEISISYRSAEQRSMSQNDDIVAQKIRTLNSGHHVVDICDELEGVYPKDFKWNGWHVQCYHKNTKVFTEKGWVYVKDVKVGDKVWSMNPKTRELELVNTVRTYKRKFKGNLINFNNKFLFMVVTPDHKMVYQNPKGEFKDNFKAEDFKSGKAIIRTAEWNNPDIKTINVNGIEIDFDDYCEFMAYWLAEGSLIRDHQICLAQQNSEKNKEVRRKMIDVIGRMGFDFHAGDSRVEFYSKEINSHLKQFGLALDKFIPDAIKNSSQRQINIFLESYCLTDGYKPKPHSFIGSRGTVFNPKKQSRTFFTSSKRMMSDLCEMIMKLGRRPYFTITSKKGSSYKFPNGTYSTNSDCYRISEAFSKTATVFKRDKVHYDDYVYDIELEANHTLYVSMEGKANWGSNCKCIREFIQKPKSQILKEIKSGKTEKPSTASNYVDEPPKHFKEWEQENRDRINGWKRKPDFLKSNGF